MADYEGIPLNTDLTADQALTVWVRYFQKRDLDASFPLIMVSDYGEDGSGSADFTELDLDEDLPENFLDGTWGRVQLWAADPELEEETPHTLAVAYQLDTVGENRFRLQCEAQGLDTLCDSFQHVRQTLDSFEGVDTSDEYVVTDTETGKTFRLVIHTQFEFEPIPEKN